MKRLLTSAAVLAVVSGTAFAADLPGRSMAPAPYIAAAPIFTWTGFYAGLNAGGAFNSGGNRTQTFTGANPTGFPAAGFVGTPVAPVTIVGGAPGNSSDNNSFAGGGQIGYNYQYGNVVFGLEADIQGVTGNSRRRGSTTAGDTPGAANSYFYHTFGNGNFNNQSNFFGTVRGRLGYAFDRFLVYGTGGFAYTGSSRNNGNSNAYINYYAAGATVPTTVFTRAGSGTRGSDNVGFAVGGGVQYAINDSWTLGAEYLYVRFGGGNRNQFFVPAGAYTSGASSVTATGGLGGFYTGNNNRALNVVRATLNYKFNFGGPSTVVAKY